MRIAFLGINGSQIRKEALEEAYRAFISEYTVDPGHIDYFRKALNEQFGKASQNDAKEAERLKAEIAQLKEKKSALVDKNFEGVISNSVLQQQLNLIDSRLLAANTALLALPDKEENLERLFELGAKYLSDPADAWAKASFKTMVKLQWCEFPQGIVFDGKKFRTTEVASIFKAKSDILPHLSHKVDFMHKSSNTPEIQSDKSRKNIQNSSTDNIDWNQYYNDLKKLAEIMQDES